jgi:hypothetical protein
MPVKWRPKAWRNKLADLGIMPRAFVDNGEIGRTDLLQLGEEALDDDDALRGFFIAVMAWGYGRSPRGPWRVGQMFGTGEALQRIRRAVEETRSGGAVEGFRTLSSKDEARLNGLGPAFGTKLLYFAGYRSSSSPRPLILDQFVGRTLDEFEFYIDYKLWNPQHYESYLLLAQEIASRSGCEPHDVECWLFQNGRRLAADDR